MGQVQFAFLDSGTGGIPYMLYLKKKYPETKCVYVGDTKNFPYGEKSSDEIIRCATDVSGKIIDKFHPEAIVIACNTMSVTALKELRKKFETPFIGTVPAIKTAAEISVKKRIGLLATEKTVDNPYTDKLIEDFAKDCTVIKRPDSKLISYIEKKSFDDSKENRLKACTEAVNFFKENDVDTIILACTHFINVAEELQCLAGDIKVIDSRDGVVRQAVKVVGEIEKNHANAHPNVDFVDCGLYTTSSNPLDLEMYEGIGKKLNLPFMGILK